MSDAIDLKHALPLPAGLAWCETCGAMVKACIHGAGTSPVTREGLLRDIEDSEWWPPVQVLRLFDEVAAARALVPRTIEACARVAENEARHGYSGTCNDIANAIRSMCHTLPELPAVADNVRLRGLIKDAEWCCGEHAECFWCETDSRTPHKDTCPAFNPDGSVK